MILNRGGELTHLKANNEAKVIGIWEEILYLFVMEISIQLYTNYINPVYNYLDHSYPFS